MFILSLNKCIHTTPKSIYQIFQLLGMGWEYFRCWEPISLIPAAIMNAFCHAEQ